MKGLRSHLVLLGEHYLLLVVSHVFFFICDHPSADPYLNTDAGTMSPFEHGEVFVLDDGGEVTNYKMLQHILSVPLLTGKYCWYHFV